MRDLGITEALAPAVPEPLVGLLVVVTALGAPKLIAVAATAGAAVGVGSKRIEWGRARRFLVALTLALSASIFLKRGLAMPRPPTALMAVPKDGYGFPSGHATAAAGLVTALLGTLSRRERWQVALAMAFVAVVAATRVLLGVHYLGDVLAGILLGVSAAALGLAFEKRRPRTAVVGAVVVAAAALVVWALS
ncbi:MAG: phosphatase PAP2 family protein [Halodesulfurarchaeum sp.]